MDYISYVTAALCAILCLAPCGAAAQDGHTATSFGAREVFYRPVDGGRGAWKTGGQVKLGLSPVYALQGSFDAPHQGQATLLGYFTPASPAAVFLLAGFGWYPRCYPHVGAGLELLLSDRWAIDGSYRFIWSGVFRPSDLRHPWGSGYRERGSLVTAALNYRF